MFAGSVASAMVLGAPDITLITLSEFVDQARRITRTSDISLMVDSDHGYGNAINVMRTVSALEAAEVRPRPIEDPALPTPFGLIRGGVAPDHQSTKRVARAFARTARHPRVHLHGHVRLHRDLSLSQLRAAYDAVLLAVGMADARVAWIPVAGVAWAAWDALSRAEMKSGAISTSAIVFSSIVSRRDGQRARSAIHNAFDLSGTSGGPPGGTVSPAVA